MTIRAVLHVVITLAAASAFAAPPNNAPDNQAIEHWVATVFASSVSIQIAQRAKRISIAQIRFHGFGVRDRAPTVS